VVVAVPVVRMVQMPSYDIVDVVAVLDRLVPAVRPVHMFVLMMLAVVTLCALVRIPLADGNRLGH
jgi:hypothetical protein